MTIGVLVSFWTVVQVERVVTTTGVRVRYPGSFLGEMGSGDDDRGSHN